MTVIGGVSYAGVYIQTIWGTFKALKKIFAIENYECTGYSRYTWYIADEIIDSDIRRPMVFQN